MARLEFTAKVTADGPGKAWYFAHFPKKVTTFLGTKASVKVAGTLNGVPFRSSALPNGDGTHHVMVNRAMREATGLRDGHTATFVLEPDTKPRTVRAPPELAKALRGNAAAKSCFAALAPSHKKAYVDFITDAKKPETRARRVQQTVQRLAAGKKLE